VQPPLGSVSAPNLPICRADEISYCRHTQSRELKIRVSVVQFRHWAPLYQ